MSLCLPTTRIIDGGLSTQLESSGVDLSIYPSSWTAGLLSTTEGRTQLKDAHRAFIDNGADIVLTSSYQTTPSTPSAQLNHSVTLATLAASESGGAASVFLSLGPYGATLADGSEYTGVYPGESGSHSALKTFHTDRLSKLLVNPVDGLAFETIPNCTELDVILEILADSTTPASSLPAWITFSSSTGAALCDGTPLATAVHSLLPSFHAATVPRYFGLNCVHPQCVDVFLDIVLPIVAENERGVAGIVLYPNNGGTWDAVSREWVEVDGGAGFVDKAGAWRDRIVAKGLECLVGGCCSTDCRTVKGLRERLIK